MWQKKSSSSHGMCIGDSDATVQLAKTTVSRLFKPLKKLTLRAIPIADVNSEKVYKQIQVLSVHSLHLHLESLFLVIRNGQGNHSVMHTLTNAAGCDAVKREFLQVFVQVPKCNPAAVLLLNYTCGQKQLTFTSTAKPIHFLIISLPVVSVVFQPVTFIHMFIHFYSPVLYNFYTDPEGALRTMSDCRCK